MKQRITIDLPWPPSQNSIWRGSGRRVYRSPEYINWIAQAHGEKLIQRVRGRIEGKFKAKIILTPPDKRAIDIDNRVKVVLDFAQSSGMVKYDSKCRKLTVAWDDERPTIPSRARLILTAC